MPARLATLLALALAFMPASALVADEAKLRPGDDITLNFREIPPDEASSLSGTYRIDSEGTVKLPYLSRFKAAGLTPTECVRSIEKRYLGGQIFSRLTVTLATDSPRPVGRSVTVMGEVNKQGSIPFSDSLTALEAIGIAGGFSEFAHPRRVKLVRGKEVRILDLSKAEGKDAKTKLLPGDLLTVK